MACISKTLASNHELCFPHLPRQGKSVSTYGKQRQIRLDKQIDDMIGPLPDFE